MANDKKNDDIRVTRDGEADTVTASVDGGYTFSPIDGGPPGYRPGMELELQDVNNATMPRSLETYSSDPGYQTDWDIASLDKAVEWLNAHASLLERMYHGIDDIKALMEAKRRGLGEATRPDGTPFGGFEWAGAIKDKHRKLIELMKPGVKQVAESIYDAADALGKVKERYQTVEKASEMSAMDWQKAVADQSRSTHF